MKTTKSRAFNAVLVVALLLSMVAFVQPAQGATPTDLFFSEYIEGSSFNKALEIYNGTGAAVDLSAYTVALYSNGAGAPSQSVTLSGSLAAADVFVMAHPSADAAILAVADLTSGSVVNYNGDDAVVLWKGGLGGTVVDAIGQVGVDPGSEWAGGGLDDTLRRLSTVCAGDTNPSDAFTFATEWEIFANNTFDGLGSHTANCAGPTTPSVNLSVSTNGASEAAATVVNVTATASSAVSGDQTVSLGVSGTGITAGDYSLSNTTITIPNGQTSGAVSFTVVDDADVEGAETATLTISSPSAGITLGATSQNITIADNDAAVVITPIHAIQGSGSAVTGPGPFTVEAIVVGDYQTQGSGQLRGFFIQEEDTDVDANPATSEGIFVFCTTCPTAVSVGDKVRVTGDASEFFNMSQLTASTAASVSVLSSGNPLPTSASVQLPVPGVPAGDLAAAKAFINAYFEPFEGMLVTFPDTLSVREYFELARYGQVILSEGGRPRQFTDANMPDATGLINHQIDLASRTIILDDTDNRQNRPSDVPNTAYYHPVPGLSISNFFRGGDTITNLTGVLHWSFAGQTGTDAWRIRPVTEAYTYAFTSVNPRSTVPDVDGSVKVASFNVLNYFLTIDTSNVCAPTQNQDCRGADSVQELERQRTKMLAALSAIDADIFGFMEMENTPDVEPLADIVAGLPGYDYIDTGVIGADAIRVGIIYKTSTVQPVGSYAILTSSDDPDFDDTRNRPALAQAFEEIATGGRITVVVNHLKSKGSGCGAGDDDTTTGQGNCNGTRTLAAQALADWLATDPTGGGDPDVLIIGDLNSYAKEDPIVALQNAGYTDMVAAFGAPAAYGYVFDGQLGYLDHALANTSLNPQVAEVAEWHINADEIPLFDYNDDVRTADEAAFEEESDARPLYEPNEFRTSDHDPVIIGLNLNAPPTVDAGGPYSVNEGGSVTLTATGSDPNGDSLSYAWDLDNDGLFETSGQSVTFSAATLDGPSNYTVQVKATDPLGLVAETAATVNVDNVIPTVSTPVVSPEPSTEGQAVSVSATFSDPGINDAPFTCTVNYGDGSGNLPGTVGGNSCTGPAHVYSTFGNYLVAVNVTDKDGGAGQGVAHHFVIFNWSGFFQPVDNLPAFNVVKAGSAIPVKFSLGGNKGLNIFAPGYPMSTRIACDTSASLDDIEQTVNAGGSSLLYGPGSGHYNYVWKTEKGWVGTCRQLVVQLTDGTTHVASFRFK